MNAKSLIATAALSLFAASSFAAEYTNFPLEASTATRAEVRAELAMARAAGEVVDVSAEYGNFDYDEITSGHTRAEAEAAQKGKILAGGVNVRRNTGNYIGG